MSSIPADNIEQVGNEPQTGPSTCAVDSEIKRMKQKNWTTLSTNTWVRRFESWYSQQPRQQAQLEEIPVQEQDRLLQEFYYHFCKQNRDEYEPDSLQTMLAALDRHMWKGNSTKGKQEAFNCGRGGDTMEYRSPWLRQPEEFEPHCILHHQPTLWL